MAAFCQRRHSAILVFGRFIISERWLNSGKIWELNMNDLIIYAGVGILLIGLPMLFARLVTNKR